MEKKEPIFIVYHIGLMGSWADIVNHQLKSLETSGLARASGAIMVSVVGPRENLPKLKQIIDKFRFKTKINLKHHGSLSLYEFPSIEIVRTIARNNPNSRILYFHTKGASHRLRADFNNEIVLNNIQWRKFLEYCVIERWQECYAYLNEYDTCGPDLYEVGKWYWGNFWWAKSEYINRINFNYINTFQEEDRYSCEHFIGGGNPQAYSVISNYHKSFKNDNWVAPKAKEIMSSFKNPKLDFYFTPQEKQTYKMGFEHADIFDFVLKNYDDAFYRNDPKCELSYLAKRVARGEKIKETHIITRDFIRRNITTDEQFNRMVQIEKQKNI